MEKTNGVVVDKVRALLTAVDLPNSLWTEALVYVADISNVTPTEALHRVKLYGVEPDVSRLQT